MMNLVVFGGDGRMKYTAQYISDNGFEASVINDISDIEKADAVILPLPFSKDGMNINGTEVSINDLIKKLNNTTTVFAGKLNDKAKSLLEKRNIIYYDYNSREEFAQKNAVPTAQGVLTFVLNNTDIILNNLKISVIGYGKCGKSICKIFKNLGSEVTSYSRRYTTKADAESEKLNAHLIKNMKETVFGADIIINTVPEKILDKKFIDFVSDNTMMIDVASFPYGFDTEYAASKNKKVNILSSLPGKYVPQTAGIIIAETIINIIEEEGLWKK